MNDTELMQLRCGEEGCRHGWQSPGGLININTGGAEPEWRCPDHRDVSDHSSHRADLRDAISRHAAAAVKEEQRRLLDLAARGLPPVVQYLKAALQG